MTRLTNTLVCHVTERLPQLYLKTKLHLLSCIGGLSKAVVKVQQARNKLSFFRQNVGLAWTEKLCSPLLAKDKKDKIIEDDFVEIDKFSGGTDEFGERKGEGVYCYQNGDIYDGDWKKGKKHGYGIYTYAYGKR